MAGRRKGRSEMVRTIANWRWVGLIGGLFLYFAGVGVLDGILAQQLRFDGERAGLLNRYDEAVRKSHSSLAEAGSTAPALRAAGAPAWGAQLRTQRGKGDASAAAGACGAGAGFGEF